MKSHLGPNDEATRLACLDFYNAVGDALTALMAAADKRAREEEREACAKVCDGIMADYGRDGLTDYAGCVAHVAAAIRARAGGSANT